MTWLRPEKILLPVSFHYLAWENRQRVAAGPLSREVMERAGNGGGGKVGPRKGTEKEAA